MRDRAAGAPSRHRLLFSPMKRHMMTRTLNVAMMGGGFMGKAHALAYAAMPMFFWPPPPIPVRSVVVDVTDALAADAKARYGFAESSNDWRAVVARPDIDVVDIVTPNDS